MSAERSTAHGRPTTGKSPEVKIGSRVNVTFGRHPASGVVLGKTITGRYAVEVRVEGADEPVTTSYTRSELHVA